MTRDSVFISYSHDDKKWLKQILVHLEYLEKDYDFNIWHDEKISKGSDWRDEIKNALDSAKIALLLVSANFLRSDFIRQKELPVLLKAAEEDGALIYSVVVSDCMFYDFEEISRYQSFNTPKNALDKLKRSERNTLYAEVTRIIKQTLANIPSTKAVKTQKSNFPDDIENALTIAHLLKHLSLNQGASFTLTEIMNGSKLRSRKYAVDALSVLLDKGLVTKIRENKSTKWSISESGVKISDKFG